jgi:FAD/FMN-containing dehydrogenase
MTLAGLGQCGIIVRARLALAAAEKLVVTRTLTYQDLDAFLSDQARLTQVAALGLLNGRLSRNAQGRWDCLLTAGSFVADATRATRPPDWLGGLRCGSASAPVVAPILTYLDRRTASITASKATAIPNPSLIVTLPAPATGPFIAEVLASPELSAGIWFFEVSPKIPARHTRPLQKMPAGPLAYELRMQRRASAFDADDHRAMLAANRRLVARALEQGGKVYPPFAPVLSSAQWQEHYGPATWQRFASAKKQFDPNNVLNPGAGIF